MVLVNGTTITMTRGDTAFISVSMTRDGEPYTPVEGDEVRFAVKHPAMTGGGKQYKDAEPVILIDIPIDSMVLTIAPADTEELDFGEYVYDIQITFADGTVDTFIPNADLVITPEVH